MRLFLFFNLILSLLVQHSFCQSKVLESRSMASKLLKTEVKYSIYLPDGYETSNRHYPVVYLLNGYTGNEQDWIQFGNMLTLVDQSVVSGKFPAMIIVMPDGDDRLYMNKYDGSYPYEDMFIQEMIPFIEKEYRIRSERQFRAISGLSMGGAGALKLAMTYPDLFVASASYSAAIRSDKVLATYGNDDQERFDNYFGRALGEGLKGQERLTEHYRKNNVFDIVQNKAPKELKRVSYYFDCGDDDYLSPGNVQLHMDLKQLGIDHEFRIRDGAHTWSFWRESLPIGLTFIGKYFSR